MNAAPLVGLLARVPRHLFFTGKGGVGKTSLACAVAVALADKGKRVLLVSTDPASNLDEVLATPLDRTARPVAGAAFLHALNIDPEAAAHAYREKVIGPLRGQLPATALRSMEEQLSGACTMEIAAFDEFARLLGDPSATADYDHVIFDTAPTGHTLRLMLLPRAWTHFLDASTTGTSCLGPLAGLDAQRGVYQTAMQTLADAAKTSVLLVSRAQTATLREAQRTAGELRSVGIVNQVLILNGLRAQRRSPCFARSRAPSHRDARVSLFSILPRPGTPCSSSTPRKRITASLVDRHARPHRRKSASCSRVCGIPPSRACCSSRCPKRRPCTRPRRCKPICVGRASSRSAGSSTRASPSRRPPIPCWSNACTAKCRTSRKSSALTPAAQSRCPGSPLSQWASARSGSSFPHHNQP